MKRDLTALESLELDNFIYQMVDQYCQAEYRFIDLVFQMGEPEDLTKDQLYGYITYLGDFRQYQLGLKSSLEVRENTLPWMEWLLSGKRHDNFFEKKVVDYSHSGLRGEVDYSKYGLKQVVIV